jgi:hypothetical protein
MHALALTALISCGKRGHRRTCRFGADSLPAPPGTYSCHLINFIIIVIVWAGRFPALWFVPPHFVPLRVILYRLLQRTDPHPAFERVVDLFERSLRLDRPTSAEQRSHDRDHRSKTPPALFYGQPPRCEAHCRESRTLDRCRESDERLTIARDGSVRLKVSRIIPARHQQTTFACRKRRHLDALLAPHGWKPVRVNVYARAIPADGAR